MLRLAAGLLALTTLAGCPGPDTVDTDTGEPVDTGPTYDEGCITVNGAGGYARLSDAVTVAPEGGVLALCEPLTETVVVDKPLVIVGEGNTPWDPPTNEPAARVVQGGELSVSGVVVNATRTGFEVEAGTLTLADVHIAGVGTYGIDAIDATVDLESVRIDAAPWGGIQADGSTLTMRGCTIEGAFAHGLALADTDAVLVDNEILDTMYTGDGTSVTDGWAVSADGGSLHLSGNHLADNFFGIEALTTELDLDGVRIDNSYFGIWIENGTAHVANTHIDLPFQYGIVALGSRDVTLDGVDITTDPETSAVQTESADGSFGVIAVDADLVIQGGLISGNNGSGVYLTNQNSTEVALVMEDTVVEDNARFGVVVFNGTMDLTDVVVSGTRNDDLCLAEDGGYACNMAVTAWVSDLVMTGGAVLDSGMFGLTALAGNVEATGVTFSGNEEFGAFVQQAALSMSDCDFDGGGHYGLYMYESNGVVRDTLFHNADWTSTSEWDNEDGTTTRSISWYQAQDIYAYGGSLVVEDTTFEHGQEGIGGGSSDIEISRCSFTDYNQQALYYYGYDGGKMSVVDSTMDDIGGYAVYCSRGEMDLERVTISDVNQVDYKWEYWIDDVLQYDNEYSYVTNGLYGYECSLSLEDVLIEEVDGTTLYTYSGSSGISATLEMDGVVLRDLGSQASTSRGAIYLDYNSASPDVWLNDVEISGIHNGHALEVYGPTSEDYAGGLVELHGLTIGGGDQDAVQGSGIVLSRVDNLALSGLEIAGVGGSGIVTTDAEGTITGVDASMDGTITGPGSYGLSLSTSELGVYDLSVSGSGASGIYVSSSTVDLDGVDVEDAGTYGLECTGENTLTHTDSTFAGDLGDESGCSTD